MSRHPFDLPLLPLSPSDPLPWGYSGSIEHRSLAALSRLDGMMSASSKADLFWLTWLMKEAQCSNVIEGTVTTFVEIAGEGSVQNFVSVRSWKGEGEISPPCFMT